MKKRKTHYPWSEYKIGPVPTRNYPSNDCQILDKVYHVAHLATAVRIVEDGKIKQGLIYDKSKLNTSRILVTWLSPNVWYHGSQYGNISFEFDFSKLVAGKNYYWVEVMEEYNPHACRILITTENFDGTLIPYVPTQGDGPWYYDVENKRHYWNGTYCLEFMFTRDLSLSIANEVSFTGHHSEYCNMKESACRDQKVPKQYINARFVSHLTASLVSVDSKLFTRNVRRGIGPAEGLRSGLEQIVQEGIKPNRDKKWGDLESDSDLAEATVKAALNFLSQDNKSDFRKMVRQFCNIDSFTECLKEIVAEKFGIDKPTLRFLDD
ncbi:hypothetical protein [Chitinophaga deserti]|uniref:hypothetical protein n=1 Tax=Chitinophaga deserti TaxID=2164099 RepID=UPI000D6CF5B2|nr:hypothetical protein [Chitinophaga deserti]